MHPECEPVEPRLLLFEALGSVQGLRGGLLVSGCQRTGQLRAASGAFPCTCQAARQQAAQAVQADMSVCPAGLVTR